MNQGLTHGRDRDVTPHGPTQRAIGLFREVRLPFITRRAAPSAAEQARALIAHFDQGGDLLGQEEIARIGRGVFVPVESPIRAPFVQLTNRALRQLISRTLADEFRADGFSVTEAAQAALNAANESVRLGGLEKAVATADPEKLAQLDLEVQADLLACWPKLDTPLKEVIRNRIVADPEVFLNASPVVLHKLLNGLILHSNLKDSEDPELKPIIKKLARRLGGGLEGHDLAHLGQTIRLLANGAHPYDWLALRGLREAGNRPSPVETDTLQQLAAPYWQRSGEGVNRVRLGNRGDLHPPVLRELEERMTQWAPLYDDDSLAEITSFYNKIQLLPGVVHQEEIFARLAEGGNIPLRAFSVFLRSAALLGSLFPRPTTEVRQGVESALLKVRPEKRLLLLRDVAGWDRQLGKTLYYQTAETPNPLTGKGAMLLSCLARVYSHGLPIDVLRGVDVHLNKNTSDTSLSRAERKVHSELEAFGEVTAQPTVGWFRPDLKLERPGRRPLLVDVHGNWTHFVGELRDDKIVREQETGLERLRERYLEASGYNFESVNVCGARGRVAERLKPLLDRLSK